MLWPTMSSASLTVSVKWPIPESIAGVIVSEPVQLAPPPVSVTGMLAPSGGAKFSVGVVPTFGASVRTNVTATEVSLVACTGETGDVVIAPEGGVTSMLKAGPLGAPLNGLPLVSVAETFKPTGPDGIAGLTLMTPSNVLMAVFVTGSKAGAVPLSRTVTDGVPLIGFEELSVTCSGPAPTGDALSKVTVNDGGTASYKNWTGVESGLALPMSSNATM